MNSADVEGLLDMRRRYMAWGLVYLVFLTYPVVYLATTDLPAGSLALGSLALLTFILLYVWLILGQPVIHPRAGLVRRERVPTRVVIVLLVLLAIVLPLVFDNSFGGLMIYASCACAARLPRRTTLLAIPSLAAVTVLVLLADHSDSSTLLTISVITLMAPFGIIGIARMGGLIRELAATREENARLAVAEERLRFARDLHDLLGHSLSLIALKAELAGRLVGRDPARTAREIEDISSVARQALVEIREAVSGYRRSFSEEVAGARSALEAAEISVRLPDPGAPLPAPVESLLGWAVRESTTNILRHSRATVVQMTLRHRRDRVEFVVDDDGIGPSTVHDGPAPDPAGSKSSGHGLRGLTERMTAAGGTCTTGPRPGGGFRLTVTVPLDAPSYASAARPPGPDGRRPEADRPVTGAGAGSGVARGAGRRR